MLLEEGYSVVGVSAPAPKGDKMDRLWGLADLKGIPLTVAGTLRADTLPDGVDLIVAAHSHDFIGRRTRDRSTLGAIGYHPSLLPLHRGRDAVRWTIRMGDRVAGGSVFWLNDTVDGGPIAAQDWCFVRPEWTAADLWREALQPMGISLLRKTLADVKAGRLVRVKQDHTLATWEPSIDQPALYRPDLPQIGRLPEGYYVVSERDIAEREKAWADGMPAAM